MATTRARRRELDPRPFIRVDIDVPTHRKFVILSDAAFRLIITAWCWSKKNGTDGHIIKPIWEGMGPAKARRELLSVPKGFELVESDLAEGVIIHDFDKHQYTAAEMAAFGAERAEAGGLGNHKRHHVAKGVYNPECRYCDR